MKKLFEQLKRLHLEVFEKLCHTIYLTLRVNPKTSIEILLGRNTINNNDLMTLTPYAFGITPSQQAQNKIANDARKLAFEKKG